MRDMRFELSFKGWVGFTKIECYVCCACFSQVMSSCVYCGGVVVHEWVWGVCCVCVLGKS